MRARITCCSLAPTVSTPAGHGRDEYRTIKTATRYHARDATRTLATLGLIRHDRNGHYATMPGPCIYPGPVGPDHLRPCRVILDPRRERPPCPLPTTIALSYLTL